LRETGGFGFFSDWRLSIQTTKEQGMARQRKQRSEPADAGRIKDPDEWTTGDEPMTGAQEFYLNTLAREAGEDAPAELTKAEASERIEELQEKTGRGR
jgi:hypothetical protein